LGVDIVVNERAFAGIDAKIIAHLIDDPNLIRARDKRHMGPSPRALKIRGDVRVGKNNRADVTVKVNVIQVEGWDKIVINILIKITQAVEFTIGGPCIDGHK
jgi:hypothetical protein